MVNPRVRVCRGVYDTHLMCFLQVKFGGIFRGSFLGGEGKGCFFGWVTYFRGVFSLGESFGVIFLGVWGWGRGLGNVGTWKGEDYLCDLT